MKHLAWIISIMSVAVCATKAMPPEPDGPRLCKIVAERFQDGSVYIGGTTGWGKRRSGSGVLLDRDFHYVTPENDFKQNIIHPNPSTWNWDTADRWVHHCEKTGQILRIHGPISPQCSEWVKDDTRSPEELRQMMTEFMTALCERYNGNPQVKWMDVVNETVWTDGTWFGPKQGTKAWENPWPKIGYDESHPLHPPLYIKQAFEIANQCAPDIQQIINQHGGMEPPMWNKVKATVLYLRENGLRVDGIGWQAHIDVGWEKKPENLRRLDELISWAHDNNLSFHITEMNVWLSGDRLDYEAQADTFAAVLSVLLKHRLTGQVTWNIWNLSDKDQWAPDKEKAGCIFFDDLTAKPAYYAIQKALLEAP